MSDSVRDMPLLTLAVSLDQLELTEAGPGED